jgi:EAL domain-containing protein (putative c-di-GMP-specific phosphodiesterase class I)
MSRTALVIDDDELFHEIASSALKGCGFDVVRTALDGLQGLKILDETPDEVDLILCDLQMPILDGAKVITELGKRTYGGQVIIISGEHTNILQSVLRMANHLSLNVRGALAKPLNPTELNRLVDCHKLHDHRALEEVSRESLERALETRMLTPFFQPKVDLRTKRVTGFEVLARHVDEDGRVSAPLPFIKSAMACSLIGTLTRSMIEQVLENTRSWSKPLGTFGLSINMSPTCILNPNLPDKISQKFRSAGFDPSRVTFEITEDRLLEDQAVTLEVLSRLRLAGFKLSLDDVGTGYASIEQIRTFPFNEVKIDRQFVMEADHDAFARFTVESVVKLSALRGISVVAEGVETKEAAELMRGLGADIAQGYLYSPALPPDEVLDWVQKYYSHTSIAA